jgi:hypothetical protein
MQEKIKYSEIMSLGFEEEQATDNVYFKEFGFPYCIITKNLTKKIYLDWEKSTQLCQMVRMKDNKTCDIMKRMPIKNLTHLKEIIEFFDNDSTK